MPATSGRVLFHKSGDYKILNIATKESSDVKSKKLAENMEERDFDYNVSDNSIADIPEESNSKTVIT